MSTPENACKEAWMLYYTYDDSADELMLQYPASGNVRDTYPSVTVCDIA